MAVEKMPRSDRNLAYGEVGSKYAIIMYKIKDKHIRLEEKKRMMPSIKHTCERNGFGY